MSILLVLTGSGHKKDLGLPTTQGGNIKLINLNATKWIYLQDSSLSIFIDKHCDPYHTIDHTSVFHLRAHYGFSSLAIATARLCFTPLTCVLVVSQRFASYLVDSICPIQNRKI